MTETSSKSVLRLTTVMFLFVGLVGIWMGGCQTPEQKIEKLISKLQHKNPKVRQTAVVALTKIGKDAVPVLIQALQDGSRGIRASAAGVLGQIGAGAVDAVPALIQALQNEDAQVCVSAAEVLGQIESGARRCYACSDTGIAGSESRGSSICGRSIRTHSSSGCGACADASIERPESKGS